MTETSLGYGPHDVLPLGNRLEFLSPEEGAA